MARSKDRKFEEAVQITAFCLVLSDSGVMEQDQVPSVEWLLSEKFTQFEWKSLLPTLDDLDAMSKEERKDYSVYKNLVRNSSK